MKKKRTEEEKFNLAESFLRQKIEEVKEAEDLDINLVVSANTRVMVDRIMRNPETSHLVMEKVRKGNIMGKINTSSLPNEYTKEGRTISGANIEPEPTTLPAKVTQELMASGINKVKWTNLKHLGGPDGNMHADIAAMTQANFKAFNIDDKSDIMTISSFQKGSLLNTPLEMNSVLGFLDKNFPSPYVGVATQDHEKVIKNYAPQIKLYHSPTMAYLVVDEPKGMGLEGKYIYAFKRKPDNKLENKKTRKLSNKM